MGNKTHVLKIATFLTLIPGIIHLVLISFQHVAPLPLETGFFVTVGIAQIFLAIQVFKSQRLKYIVPAIVLNLGLALLWVVTRSFRAPFMTGPEHVDSLGLFVLVMEVLASASLLYWKWLDRHRIAEVHGYSFAAAGGLVLVVSLLFGSSVYAAGITGEFILPNRTLDHGHAAEVAHDDGDDHHDDEILADEKMDHSEANTDRSLNDNDKEDDHPHTDDDNHS